MFIVKDIVCAKRIQLYWHIRYICVSVVTNKPITCRNADSAIQPTNLYAWNVSVTLFCMGCRNHVHLMTEDLAMVNCSKDLSGCHRAF